jgi:rhodanese-related sulfurtransferase
MFDKRKEETSVTKPQVFNPKIVDGVPEILPEELKDAFDKVTLIDVRRPEEYTGELSHIPGAKLITLGPDLEAFLEQHDRDDEIIFICRSGARSGHATLQSRSLGFTKTVNLHGGMILWNQLKLPTAKV